MNLISLVIITMSCFFILFVVFTLYYFVNVTSENLIQIMKNICLAYAVNFALQIFIFAFKFTFSASLRNIALLSKEQINIINNFWDLYQQ